MARTLGFTQAARRLGLRRSTVSRHVRRPEEATGRQLFTRDIHSVEPAGDGEAMLGFARRILDAREQATRFLTGARPRGRPRSGAPEDFVLTQRCRKSWSAAGEPGERFRREHPEVGPELTAELPDTPHERLEPVPAERRPEDPQGEPVRHDEPVWTGAPGLRPDPGRPVRDADLETGVRRAVVAASTLVPQAGSIRTFRAPAQPFAEGQGPLTLKRRAIERTYEIEIEALRRA